MHQVKFVPVLIQQKSFDFYTEVKASFSCYNMSDDIFRMYTLNLSDETYRLEQALVLVNGKSRYYVPKRMIFGTPILQKLEERKNSK